MGALAAALALLAASASAQTALQVVSRQPSGATESRGAGFAVTATFNQPMTPLSSAEAMGEFCPLRLEPAVKGRCRWMGTHVLSFEPAQPLGPARRFKAVIPAGTKSKVSGAALTEEVSWEFETPRPQLVSSVPRDGERWIDLKALLFLHFNQDMDPKRARGFVVLEERLLDSEAPAETVSVGLRRATPEELKSVWPWARYGVVPSTGNVLVVKPARLRQDRAYRLKLKADLPGAEGELGLPAERKLDFETWYSFRLAESPVKHCLPADFRVAFTNPVKHKDFLESLSVEPSTPIPVPEHNDWTGYKEPERRLVAHELPEVAWKPDSSYVFKISGKLSDVFGNKLGQDQTFVLATDGFCPYLDMPQGFGVLESYLPPRHPVDAVNVPQAELQKFLVRDEEFIPFYQSLKWGCEQASPAVSAASPLKLWDLSLPRNARLHTFIDLAGPLGERKGGLVFSQLQSPAWGYDRRSCWLKAVDDVTRLGLTVKDSLDSTLIWTTFLRTGAPAPGVPVELRDEANRLLWQGRTDAKGLADAPGWKGLGIADWKRWARPKLWALAKDPGGTAVLSTDQRGAVSPWRFNVPFDFYPRPTHYRGSLFTDRGVYRPGESVRVKGILRRLADGDWRPLGPGDPRRLDVTVRDPRGAEAAKSTVAVSGESSFDLSHDLPEGAPTGIWTIEVGEAKKSTDTALVRPVNEDEEGEYREYEGPERRIHLVESFRVEAFKPAAFEVKAVPARESFLSGDSYAATVEGWYLFGAPMAEAPADWTLRLEPSSYSPPGWEGWEFAPPWWERTAETGRLVGSGKGTLDRHGKLEVKAELEPGKSLGAMAAVLEAAATSPERQRLFGRSTAVVHRADLYFGIKASRGFVEAGKEWRADLAAVRPDGKPAPGLAAEARLTRRDWLSVQRAGLGGRLEWVSETRDTLVSSSAFTTSGATVPWSVAVARPGFYFFSLSGKDERGRETQSAVSFYAVGQGESYWARSDSDIVELVTDKASYKPGETARLLVKSPYKRSRALITVEREGIISRRTAWLEGGAQTIDVPVTDAMVPNAYVSVTLVQGRAAEERYEDDGGDASKPQAKFGYAGLPVDPGGRRITLAVSTDKERYRPRQRVRVTVKASDDGGHPAQAEVTVFAVDEGVLALTGYRTPDPFSEFYGSRNLLVGTADSRLFVIGQRSFGEKGKSRGGGGGRGLDLEGVDLRSRFLPTAFWEPSAKTGPSGTTELDFELPDNLSRFRVMAVAHAGRRFGSGDSRFAVAKPLLLRPSLPRLARPGDEFWAGVVVHNNSASTMTVTLRGSVSGGAVRCEGEETRALALEAGSAAEALWKCRAEALGEAVFAFKAGAATPSGTETDGLERPVPVRLRERVERSATSGVAEPKALEALASPPGAIAGSSVSVALSASALAGLQEGARFLLEYPYGCLEQTLSRMLPVITGAELVSTFGLGTVGDLKAETQKGLDKLPEFQHPSGGYGYWPSPHLPDPFVTAYALEVAALAAKEGYRVPPSVERAVAWLRANLSSAQGWAYPYSESEIYAARAYSLYALALHGQPMRGVYQQLYDRRDQLPYLAKAYLLKAAARLAAPPQQVRTIAAELLNQARVAPRSLHFEEPMETRMPWVHESSVKTTALALQAFLEAQGGFPDDQKAASWLVNERKAGRWRTTQENAQVLRTLQDFYRRYETETPDFTARLSAEGASGARELWSEKFLGRSLRLREREFSAAEIFGESREARLSFAKEGAGRLYYSASLAFARPSYEKASEGFEIERKIEPLTKGDDGLKAGRRAVVTLTVRTPQDRTFVAVEDALPAGLEIVDPSFAVEGREDARLLAEKAGRAPWWGGFQRSEKYDDRIVIFADFLSAGEHRYSYLVQATTPGRYHAPAAWVEQMYEPEVFGRTSSGEVVVEK